VCGSITGPKLFAPFVTMLIRTPPPLDDRRIVAGRVPGRYEVNCGRAAEKPRFIALDAPAGWCGEHG